MEAHSPNWRDNFLNSLKRLSDSLQLCGESLIFAPSKSYKGHEAAAPINMKAAYFMLRAKQA